MPKLTKFQAYLAKLLDAQHLTNLTQAHVGLDESKEHGLEFQFTVESSLFSPPGVLGTNVSIVSPSFSTSTLDILSFL